MIFPEYLKAGDTIGVTALSHSIEKEQDQIRFRNAEKMLALQNYSVRFTQNVFLTSDRYGRSSSAAQKTKELQTLLLDPSVKAIYSAAGGDFLAEILPYVDLDAWKEHPKWLQGYSDNTSILYYLTTRADIATAYGANFGDFGMGVWDESVKRGLQVLEGKCREQKSFLTYQNGFGSREDGLEGYQADEKVEWKCINSSEKQVTFSGRLLGGCLDVLLNLAGTPYDGTLDFIEKYKKDGIIWYLESFDLHFEQLMEGLWKLKEMGWFSHVKGFVFGRPLFYPMESWDGTPLPTYDEILLERLAMFNVPIITGADIGHKGPQFVTINGALASIECGAGKGVMKYI